MAEPGFWDDPEKATAITKEAGNLKQQVEKIDKLDQAYEDIEVFIEMAEEEEDESMLDEIKEQLEVFEDEFSELRMATLLSGEYDERANKGFTVEEVDFLEGDVAGIKSVTFEVHGENAYGYLKSEHGVHRLVRISPFNANGKRQTSFSSCEVMPELDTDIEIEINDDDIRIDTYRSSGAGGQHINKTSSAIRITHFPTGIVVQCQNERSQHMNKDKAMQMLKTKLYMRQVEEQKAKAAGIRGDVKDIDFGSQIRSYFLQPYTLIKDLRTQYEKTNADAVLDGDIDGFIDAYLIMINKK